MRSLERRLAKQKKLAEFNLAFQEIVDRGVFRELTAKELALWSGPVNYISTVTHIRMAPTRLPPSGSA